MADPSPSSLQDESPITQALKDVTAAVEKYTAIVPTNAENASVTEKAEVSDAQTAMFRETTKLLLAVRGPVDMIFSHFENVSAVPGLVPVPCLHAS